jgi:hypothetical protein
MATISTAAQTSFGILNQNNPVWFLLVRIAACKALLNLMILRSRNAFAQVGFLFLLHRELVIS